MVLRKALFWWQFAAVIVLPTVLLIARGILGSSMGWDFVLYLVLSPILAAFMLLVAGLMLGAAGYAGFASFVPAPRQCAPCRCRSGQHGAV